MSKRAARGREPDAGAVSATDARRLLRVLTAVKKGDFSARMPIDRSGTLGKIAETLNDIVELNERLANELERVRVAVIDEGRINRRAQVPAAVGAWAGSVESINALVSGIAQPTLETGRVIRAVAQGDLSQRAALELDGRPLKGEFLRTATLVNAMVDQLGSFASEVTRVAREVGTEGKLGGQAVVKGVGGTWKDLTDNVNSMASNLTSQVRNIAEVTTAVARGDLSKKITVDVRGEILELKNTINVMVDQLSSFASEVTRVAREVGTEGKLGGQAVVKGVGGTWKDLTDNVNSMASNLTTQVRNIADVTTAVANGDLSKKITVDVRGEILELKVTINTMVDQLSSFASEVTRVAREVGTEGKLGGQAVVKGVGGTWQDLTDNVNSMASNLTTQVRNIADVTTAVANGDLSKKITVNARGEILELKQTINTMVDQLGSFASEVTRVAREVGTEGKLGGQAVVRGVGGTWKDLTDNVNSMASNLTSQVRNIADVTTAVANGDLSKKITVDVRGEILELKNTINTMVDQLSSFASEVTRVAREVGTEGKLGGQAVVSGVAGTWKDLTDNVNSMATNLTTQVREIAKVVTHVANGDLKRKLVVNAQGEIAQLADTINGMIDTLAVFADQVSSVAREVGIEGKLGGQARVPGTTGIWRNLTENVNQLAANLTTQVRAIAEVATAVTKGDLTRSISVDAQGEVASLKDNINEMIRNLKDTTQKNTEQDWLKTNLARFSRVLQGQRHLLTVSRAILSEMAPMVRAQRGSFFVVEKRDGKDDVLRLLAGYALEPKDGGSDQVRLGEGLVGQCALDKEPIFVVAPLHNAVRIGSSLADVVAPHIAVLPVLFEGEVKAVLELASLTPFSDVHLAFLKQVTESIGIVLNTISANMRTESLLKQSQTLADVLRSTNEELQEKAQLLSEQKTEVERKNEEVEQAKRALEEKAEQLALTSKYKSEFLANMSHELRTPLNSLLLLAQSLAENTEGNLSNRQVEYARTIHASGADLMELINDILDLSKIESGTMTVNLSPLRFTELKQFAERTFRQVASGKRLDFTIDLDNGLPEQFETDGKRLQQVLRNLLSNAFKFTDQGRVELRIAKATSGYSLNHPVLSGASSILSFTVTDTGIGIPRDKHEIIFEAFQQADGTTSRRYGGTGLGLSISRDIARLLGGEIRLDSSPGNGSVFTLYLPLDFVPVPRPARETTSRRLVLAPRAEPVARPSEGVLALGSGSDEAFAADADSDVDDRATVAAGDPVLLLATDQPTCRATLFGAAHAAGFKVLAPTQADSLLKAARELSPAAVVVDLNASERAGWVLLDRLKNSVDTLHLPVFALAPREKRLKALDKGASLVVPAPEQLLGALQTLTQPRGLKTLLVVDAESNLQVDLAELLGGDGVRLAVARTVEQARQRLQQQPADAWVIGVEGLREGDLQRLRDLRDELSLASVPLVAFVAKDTTRPHDVAMLQAIAGEQPLTIAHTPERVLAETCRFAQRAAATLMPRQHRLLQEALERDPQLAGRTVLIVDDDVRNIFALTATLEQQALNVRFAESGQAGIEMLEKHADIDLVLMDVMMPEMDGYQAMRAIRAMPAFKHTPIISLTARAMKGDREKCIASGASDYIAKPVDVDKLRALLRVWLDEVAPAPLTDTAHLAEAGALG